MANPESSDLIDLLRQRGSRTPAPLGRRAIAWAAAAAFSATFGATSGAAAGAAASASERFGFYGLSPVAAGQALAQAEAALGAPLKPEPPARPAKAGAGDASRCHYRGTEHQPGVRYAVDGEVITRIETRDARYVTVSGVHVGDSADRVRQVYGKRLSSTPHPYFDQGSVLTVYSADRRFALVMEANDQGRIITLRGGRLPEVGWLEGCG